MQAEAIEETNGRRNRGFEDKSASKRYLDLLCRGCGWTGYQKRGYSDRLSATQFQKPGKRSKADVSARWKEQRWVKQEAERDASCCKSNPIDTRTSQQALRNRRRYPGPGWGGERLTLRSSVLRLGRDLGEPGTVVVQTAGSHAHVVQVLGIGKRRTTNVASVLGSCKLQGECTLWEGCFKGGEGGLQELLVGMRASGCNTKRRAREPRVARKDCCRGRDKEDVL